MAVGAATIGALFVGTGAGLLVLLREPIGQPEKPGSRWFALAVVGISLWPVSLGASYLLADPTLSVVAWYGRAVAASLISVSWFLVAVEYTTRRSPSRLLIAGVAGYVVLDLVVTATNPVHTLVLTDATTQTGTVLVPDYGPWFWARTVLNYGFILLATALFAVEWNGSSGLRRRQAGILTLAVVPPILANLLTLLSAIPSIYDMTPLGLVGSGFLLTWALYRVEFLDVVPVAREAAMEEMHDAVVTLDDEDRVVDCNAAARTLFDAEESYAGTSADEFFATVPPGVFERFSDAEDVETEVTLETRDGTRHFSVSISPVRIDEDVAGRVIVLRDITPLVTRERELEARQRELRERQRQLDLLRQVLTRVIRHNLRNALTAIHGSAEILSRDRTGDDGDAEHVDRILDASDDLLDISDKAGHVERIIAGGQQLTYDLAGVAQSVVEDCRERYPDVVFETDLPESCSVQAGPGLEVAVEAVLENAAEYGDDESPRVAVRVVEDGPRIEIEDNGDGIDDDEVAVLEAEEETALRHGSGIGLWLVKWVADHAGAALAFDASSDGTTVTMDFGADVEPTQSAGDAPAVSTEERPTDSFDPST